MDTETVKADAYFRNNYSFLDFQKSIFPEVQCDVYLDEKFREFQTGRLVLTLDQKHLERYMYALSEYTERNEIWHTLGLRT